MGDGIGGVKKMGAGNRHSVALVLLVSTLIMLVATSHCKMSTTTTTSAGNSTAASSAWCDGYIIDGQCILIPQAYGGGEPHFEYLDMDVMDMMVAEYDDSGESSSRRVLVTGGGQPKLNLGDSLKAQAPTCTNSKGQRYTCQNPTSTNGLVPECPVTVMYNRVCPL